MRFFFMMVTEQLYLSLGAGLGWDQLQARAGPQLQGCVSRNVSSPALGSGFVGWKEMQGV